MRCVFVRSAWHPRRAASTVRPLLYLMLINLGFDALFSAIAFASGMTATSACIHLLNSGDHVVSIDDVYGGTQRYFRRVVTPVSRARFLGLPQGFCPGNVTMAPCHPPCRRMALTSRSST
jgi:hypothetical protein